MRLPACLRGRSPAIPSRIRTETVSIMQLNLVPSHAEAVPADLEALATGLRQVGFIGDAFDSYGETRFLPGPNFHAFVHFRSSHPVVRLAEVHGELVPVETIDSRDHCTIRFSEVTPTPEFLGGPPTEAPFCRSCGFAELDWPDVLTDWYPRKSQHRWVCPGCGVVQCIYDWDWKDTAAFGRFKISIRSIAFREAEPAQALLEELFRMTGFTWKHYYWDDSP